MTLNMFIAGLTCQWKPRYFSW